MATNHGKPALLRVSLRVGSLWFVLFAVWMMIESSLAAQPALVGAVITFALAAMFAPRSEAWRLRGSPRAWVHFVAYLATFAVELVRANLNMLRYIYARRVDIKPGIVKVRIGLKSPLGRLVLANSIALTPGSLVVEIADDAMFVHWLDVKATGIDEATRLLVTPFEKHLEKVFG
ncbi:MAG TPA: Na+/H+ antiporter subunit E [Paraburkholderia sp.]